MTGDAKDVDIVLGDNSMIWAKRSGSSSLFKHSSYGLSTVNFITDTVEYKDVASDVNIILYF